MVFYRKKKAVGDRDHIKQVAVLRKSVVAWNEWRAANPEIRHVGIAGAKLRRAKLAGANLRGATLIEADLGTVREEAHSGDWFFDGTYFKRKYTKLNGKQQNSSGMSLATFRLEASAADEIVATDDVRRISIKYQRVAPGTRPSGHKRRRFALGNSPKDGHAPFDGSSRERFATSTKIQSNRRWV